MLQSNRRTIPGTDLSISPVSLGCWPIAGISSLEVTEKDSIATIRAASEAGINHFDTAYSYGYNGESDRLLRQAFNGKWDGICIASKVGSHYNSDHQRILDCSPERIRQEADEIRSRLNLDTIPILYLHTPDGKTPIEKVAETFADMQHRAVFRHAALSNTTADETRLFSKILKPVLIQPPFNMLQQETLQSLRSVVKELPCGVATYWPLMKGLLAGKLARDHVFDPKDRRPTYSIYQGAAWEKSQDFLDKIRSIAEKLEWTVVRLVVRWTMDQEGVTTVLCGAKRPDQIAESAEAMHSPIPDWANQEIQSALDAVHEPPRDRD